jgi:hypothetical protein
MKMDDNEKIGWGRIIDYYNLYYGRIKRSNPKKESSKVISERILLKIWGSTIPYNCLGDYMKNYQDYTFFKGMVLKMKNKKRRGSRMEKGKNQKPTFQRGYAKTQKFTSQRKYKRVRKNQPKRKEEYSGPPISYGSKSFESMSQWERENLGLAE